MWKYFLSAGKLEQIIRQLSSCLKVYNTEPFFVHLFLPLFCFIKILELEEDFYWSHSREIYNELINTDSTYTRKSLFWNNEATKDAVNKNSARHFTPLTFRSM